MWSLLLATLTGMAALHIGDGAQCHDGWSLYGGSCYVLLMEPVTWYEGKVACQAVGGRLVEIDNANDNNFVSNLLKGQHASYAWTGLQDLLVEGQFVWVTSDASPAYTNFHPGQPDDNGHSADCVVMRGSSGEWYDDHCHSSEHPAVCQRAANEEEEVVG